MIIRPRDNYLLKGGAAWFPFSLGGVAFPLSFVVLLPSFFTSFGWGCFPFPPSGSGAFSLLVCLVAQLGFPPLGGVAVFSSPSGAIAVLHLLWVELSFLLFSWVVLLGPLLLWAVLRCPSLFAWCCLPFPPLVWDYFSPVLLGPLLLGVVLRPALSPPPPLGGVAFSLSFGVVLPSFPSFGWARVPSLFGWVVLLGPLLLRVVLRCPSFFLRGAAFLFLLWGGTAFPLSSVGSCFVSSSFGRSCFSNFLLCAAAFLLLLWVVLLSFSSFG